MAIAGLHGTPGSRPVMLAISFRRPSPLLVTPPFPAGPSARATILDLTKCVA